MAHKLHKRSILKKTASISLLSLMSKFLGIIREIVQVSYLGVGSLSDAFNAALKLPTVLRKLFAEGALSAAFIPTIIRVMSEESQEQASKLVTLTYCVFGTVVLMLCLLVSLFPQAFITLIAQGFTHKPVEMAIATDVIRIVIYYVFFMFTSALLASALQAKMHFTIPAWGPALLNVFYIAGILICLKLGLSVDVFSYFMLLGGLIQSILYGVVYFSLHFQILWPDAATYRNFKEVMFKFIPCLLSVGIIEINLIIDNRFASTLPSGSVTLLSISSKFMMIALGAFAGALSTILLPHFSRVSTYAPKRMSFYLLESGKLIFWVIVPIVLLMSYFSYTIFYTIFYRLAGNFTLDQVNEGSLLLRAFLPGLFFFSLNKVLLSIYYALHETRYAMYITIIGALANVLLNRLLMPPFGTLGIASATVLAAVLQSLLLLMILRSRLGFKLYLSKFSTFALYYMGQVCIAFGLFLGIYSSLAWGVKAFVPEWADLLLNTIGTWFWVGPICLGVVGILFYARNKAGVSLYFLD